MKLLVLSILVSSAGLTTAQFIKNYAQIDAEIRSKFATLSSPRLNSVSGSLIKYLDPVSNLLESLQRGEELLLDDDDNWASHVSRTCLDDSKFLVHSLRNYFRGILLYLAHNNDTDADGIEKAKEGLGNITQNFWALKVIDAFGKPSAGLLNGNTFWLGDFKECRAAFNENKEFTFKGKYCLRKGIVHIETLLAVQTPDEKPDGSHNGSKPYFPTTLQTEHIYSGLCMPATCSDSDVEILYWAVGTAFHGKNIPNDTDSRIVCHDEDRHLGDDGAAVAMICVCSVILFFMVAGTIYDLYVYQPGLKRMHLRTVASRVSLTVREVLPSTPAPVREYESGLPAYERFFMCFSVYSNGLKILSTEKRDGQLDCIHGIRCISMSWVILGHTYFYAAQYIDNLLYVVQNMLTEFPTQAIMNATVSVDTFLVISGSLLAYLWLKEAKKNKGENIKKPYVWFLYYFHRYVRLTPVYMLITGMSIGLFGYITDGPLWDQNGVEPNRCRNSWYWNMLYLNNFFQLDEKCMGHTWYLADDMQYYVLSPILLLAYWFYDSVAYVLSGVLMGVSFALSAYIILANNYAPNGMQSLDFQRFNADSLSYFNDYYIKPYTRCGPYLVGLFLGYVLYKLEGKKLKIPWMINSAIWFGVAAMNTAVLYGLYDVARGQGMASWVIGLYSAVNRTVWGVGVAWVIFACVTGNGGPIDTFLSWDGFKPLSRLTYCAYLSHPLILQITYNGGDRALHFDSHYTMVYYFLANLVMAYAAAFVLSLAFESPVMGLEKLLLPSRKPSTIAPSERRDESDTDVEQNKADVSPDDSVIVMNVTESPESTTKRVQFTS